MYPALAVLQAARPRLSDVLWVGGEGGMEAALVARAGLPFEAIPAAGVHGVGLRRLPGNLWRLARGVIAARRILRRFRPDALLFTGGYVAVPMALAGRRVPSLLYVPDIEPGLALKALARFAKVIALTAEDSRRYFHGRRARLVVTGYPVRPELLGWERERARAHLHLKEDRPVVLVAGGSKGARSINQAVLSFLPTLLERAQVVHLTGELDWPAVSAAMRSLPSDLSARYHAFPYLHEDMGAALAAADLAVSRAGASTLGEYPLFGLPAVLVPYPFAWRYQKVNADALARSGAAVILPDNRLHDDLPGTLIALLENPSKLRAMREAMLALRRPDAAAAIADQLLALAAKE